MWILIYQYYQKYMICITLIDTFCISNIFQANEHNMLYFEHNMLYFKEQKSQLVLKSFSNFFVKSEITLDFKECMCYNIDRLDRPT